jgi:flagellar export protein FliJ
MSGSNNFRLDPVLNYTASVVDTLELEFAQLKLAHKNEVEILERLEAAKIEEMEQLQHQQQGLINCEAILLRQQYLRVIDTQVKRQKTRVKTAEQKVNAKREELVENMKSQKTLEKLKENHMADQQVNDRRREARLIDDIVTTRYARER